MIKAHFQILFFKPFEIKLKMVVKKLHHKITISDANLKDLYSQQNHVTHLQKISHAFLNAMHQIEYFYITLSNYRSIFKG